MSLPLTIAITHTEQPQRMAYLSALLAQLANEFPSLQPKLFPAEGRHLFPNIDRCFRWLATAKTLCLYLQEDVLLADGFAAKLEAYTRDYHQDVSYLYTHNTGTPPFVQLWPKCKGVRFEGGECAVLADAIWFQRYRQYVYDKDLSAKKTGHDLFVSGWLKKRGARVRAPIPSLVQHIGVFSAKAGHNFTMERRVAPTFPGKAHGQP